MALGDIVLKTNASFVSTTLDDLGALSVGANATIVLSDMFELDIIAYSTDLAAILTANNTDPTAAWVEDYTRSASTPRDIFTGNLRTVGYGLDVNSTGLEFNGSQLQLNGTVAELAAIAGSANNVLYFDGSGDLQEAAVGATSGIQGYDAGLTSIAGLSTSANQMIYTTGSDTYATTALTAFARTLLDDADAAAARVTLGIDQLLNGLSWKHAVKVSTTTDLATEFSKSWTTDDTFPLTGEFGYNTTGKFIRWFSGEGPTTLDGISLSDGDRILVKDEGTTTGLGNSDSRKYQGIYIRTDQDNWTRADDMDEDAEFINAAVFVSQGTAGQDVAWVQTADNVTLDSTSLIFAQFSSAGSYTASDGITIVGNDIQLDYQTGLSSAAITDSSRIAFYAGGGIHNYIEYQSLLSTFAGTGLTNEASSPDTLGLDWPGLTAITEDIADTDTFAVYNTSAATHHKLTFSQLYTTLQSTLNLVDNGGVAGTANQLTYWSDSDSLTSSSNLTYSSDVLKMKGTYGSILIDTSGDPSPYTITDVYNKGAFIADSPQSAYSVSNMFTIAPTFNLRYHGPDAQTQGNIGPGIAFTVADDGAIGGYSGGIRVVKSDTDISGQSQDGALMVLGTREADGGGGNAKVKEAIRIGHNQWTGIYYKPDNSAIPPAMLTIGTADEEDVTIAMRETTATIDTITNYGQFYVKSSDGKPYFKTSSGTEYDLTSGAGGISGSGAANQLTYWDGTSSVTSSSGLTWNNALQILEIGTPSGTSALYLGNQAVLSDSPRGTISLSNIDSIDTTTENTIKAELDVLTALTTAASLSTVGTITTGTWNGSVIQEAYGGTGESSYTLGDLLYGDAVSGLTKLSGNTSATKQFLSSTGTGTVAQAPTWSAINISDVGGFTDNSSNWDAAYNDKINSASFATGTGVLTLTQQDGGTVTADLDGRFVEGAGNGLASFGDNSASHALAYWTSTNEINHSDNVYISDDDVTDTYSFNVVDPNTGDAGTLGAGGAFVSRDTQSATLSVLTFNNDLTNNQTAINGWAGRGSAASPAAVQSGDILRVDQYVGMYGTGTSNSYVGALFRATASENWSASSLGTDWAIFTALDGTTTTPPDGLVQRMVIAADGSIKYNSVGQTDNANWKLYTTADNDFQFAGFRLETNTLRVKLSQEAAALYFSVGENASTEKDMMKIDPIAGSTCRVTVYGQMTSELPATPTSATASTTIDWDDGNGQIINLNASITTLTLSNPVAGSTYFLKLVQDATGSRTITWPTTVKWPGGTAPTLTTAANSVDTVVLFYDGSNYYANFALNYSS